MVLAVAVLVLAGCRDDGGQLRLSALRRVPGAAAARPGSTEYRRLETDASANAMVKTPAEIRVDACSPDGRARVRAWFDETLRDAGWSRDGLSPVSDRGEFRAVAIVWSRGSRHLELRFLADDFADRLAGEAGGAAGCPAADETILYRASPDVRFSPRCPGRVRPS